MCICFQKIYFNLSPVWTEFNESHVWKLELYGKKLDILLINISVKDNYEQNIAGIHDDDYHCP